MMSKSRQTLVRWWCCRSSIAGVVRGRNGFRKDKGGEKLDETEENLLEHRTDGTDAFDTLFIGCEKFPYREIFPVSASGVL